MKHSIQALTVLIAFVAAQAFAEQYLVVKVSDIQKQNTYKVMSAGELADLEKDIAIEKKVFPEAEREAQKEWKDSELTKKDPFPGVGLGPREVAKEGVFTKKEEADAKVSQLENQEAKSEERKAEKDKKQAATQTQAQKDAAKKKQDKAGDRASLKAQAADLLNSKVQDLVAKEKAKASGATPADKPADKPADQPAAKKVDAGK